jgi:predicted acetyltransferase
MLRLLDAPLALAARGYSTALATTVDLSVTDPVLPENEGAYRLRVADGEGTVEPIAAARLRLDAGALASLYTGWSSAHSLAALGRLTGATDAELARLDLLFAGPKPWMAEII